MKTKIAVVSVPFILSKTHFNLAKSTLLSLLSNKHEYDLEVITVVNRFDVSQEDFIWLKNISQDLILNDKNILARAWNIGIERALSRGAELILVSNLDIFFDENFLENIVTFAKNNPTPIVWGGKCSSPFETMCGNNDSESVTPSVHFSCFLCDQRLFAKVGKFDEGFIPAYHEDTDMLYRISLAGDSVLSTSLAHYQHLDRGTLKGAAESGLFEFALSMQSEIDKSLEYYCKKWGGPPGQEIYIKPFGV